jgi:hypothetical protein
VLAAGIAKQLCGARRICDTPRLLHDQVGGSSGVGAILEEALQRTGEHLLEADNQNAVGSTVRNHVATHVEACRARGAVVVDIVHGNTGHAELVEHALAARRVAIAVARNALVNVVVVDVRIEHGFDTGLEAELGVVDLATGLDELCHSDAEDVDGLLLRHHCGGCTGKGWCKGGVIR